ncbi:DUF1631 family protein [Marinobacter sp.]|uniref:DUF1631 family protein n=1 Tax=Marinobacter sp. TaxID=50741 RepID=UPI00384B8838
MDPKERRASLRQPIKLAAQIVMEPEKIWPCQIADFCAEGLFLRYSGETSRRINQTLAHTGRDEFVVRFRGLDGRTRHELQVRVVRRMDSAMGVVFSSANPAAVGAMLHQCGADRNQERSALKPPGERVQFVLHQCARAVVQHVEPLMDACFGSMTEGLQEAARRAPSDQQANDYMDTAGQVPIRQRVIWHQMMQSLESPLKPGRKSATAAELSLVDKGDFEDWLTIRVMITKADTLYRHELLQLRMRFDKLSISNATGHQNPLGPALVCEAFAVGLQQLKASRTAGKICLKAFDTVVLQALGPLYVALNDILIRQGVLPDLDLSKYLSERSGRPEPQPLPKKKSAEKSAFSQPDPQPEKAPGAAPAFSRPSRNSTGNANEAARSLSAGFRSSARMAQSAFATVKNLLGTLSAGRANEPAPFPPEARPLSAGEFQRELQQLQSHGPSQGTETGSLKDRVVGQIRAGGGLGLNEEQQDTLDVVDRFFQSVAESPKLSEGARQQLRQLEIPVLKVVLRDSAFFDDQTSPVRGVMDRLAQLGGSEGRPNPVVQRRVEELVQRITSEFEQDTRVFERVMEELDTLVERQKQVYQRNVERVTAAAEGSQKVAESRVAVGEALDQRLAGQQVPRVVMTLLSAGWRDLLSLTWIRQGPESPLWHEYLVVVDSLISFGRDMEGGVNLPELLRTIQDGMASISSSHMPSSQVRDELKEFLVRAPGTPVDMVDIPAAPPQPECRESRLAERERRSLQRWVNRVQKLRTGDWMCNQEKADRPQYMRVVWIARGFNRFVFVNNQGMRVVELELEDLARQMQKGILIQDTLYDRPLVDESIDRMVRNVYDQLSWAATHDQVTGLLCRHEFERMLEQQLNRHEDERTLARMSLRLVDSVPEKIGDPALVKVADILRAEVGDGMPLARLEGNEFSFLLPSEAAETIAERIIRAVENIELIPGGEHRLTASAGLAPGLSALTTAERWLGAAGEVCRSARDKAGARIMVCQLDAGDHVTQQQIAARVAGLGQLDVERMLLRCQKIIPLHGETSMGAQYEVLISMYDEAGNLIPSAEFVRMAERYNHMQAVDRWVVGHMLDWLTDSRKGRTHTGGMCVKLSGYSLNDEALLEFIYDRLSQKDAPIERLWFEITEPAEINNLTGVVEFIEEMKELGCRFCLGRFGSGAASHEYLRRLPVDLIKLDGACVQRMMTSEADHAVVRSMVNMAHYMKREVIASQVETRETLEALRMLGVDYAQGYAIEKPGLLSSLT